MVLLIFFCNTLQLLWTRWKLIQVVVPWLIAGFWNIYYKVFMNSFGSTCSFRVLYGAIFVLSVFWTKGVDCCSRIWKLACAISHSFIFRTQILWDPLEATLSSWVLLCVTPCDSQTESLFKNTLSWSKGIFCCDFFVTAVTYDRSTLLIPAWCEVHFKGLETIQIGPPANKNFKMSPENVIYYFK